MCADRILKLINSHKYDYGEIALFCGVTKKEVRRIAKEHNIGQHYVKSFKKPKAVKRSSLVFRNLWGSGYVWIRTPKWYDSDLSRVPEQHVVVCKNLGLKSVPKGYNVHHCDGRHNNNNFSNLVLLPKYLHSELHNYLSQLEGVTTISKESTLKWVEARRKGADQKTLDDIVYSAQEYAAAK